MSEPETNMSANAPARDFRVVDPDTMDWINARASWIVDQFGWERIRSCPVVLPTAEFFPAPYSETEEGARALLDQMCGHLDIDPDRVELHLFFEGARVDGGATALGLYQQEADRFNVWASTTLLHEPEGLAATMAHELCHIHLLGHQRVTEETDDHEPLTDLLTVFLGMGVLTSNAALRERSDDWMWQIGQRGYLTMPMYGYAQALFSQIRGETAPSWSTHLRPDVRDAFQRSLKFFSEQGLPDLRRVRTTAARPRSSGIDAIVDTSSSEVENDGLCRFCGVELPVGDRTDDVCQECQESIVENDLDIEEDVSKGGTTSYRTWHRYRLLALAFIFLTFLVMVIIDLIKVF